ncbi:hypothetical protein ACQ5SO_12725 [Rhodovulum sp. DZ06]|uniref:hypothetical protein n=1 Tax=Rhodovulum sp. DZ06 TaxID=3425126 RepID=UPI003D3579D6
MLFKGSFLRAAARPAAISAAALSLGLAAPAPAAAQVALPSAADWQDHVLNDLLPFWSVPDALGDPVGAFPSRRCDDGTLAPAGAPCPTGGNSTVDRPDRWLVAQSRQVFAYGVAFHMTGDPQWLELAQAGTQNLFDTYSDPVTGMFHRGYSVRHDSPAGAPMDQEVQTQVYGLLGPTFLYYLTGDPALYAQIRATDQAIQSNYWLGDGAFSRFGGEGVAADRIAGHLDPLNTYIHMLARMAPEADRAGYLEQSGQIAHYIRDNYWNEERGLLNVLASTPDGRIDFGHNAKTLWFIAQTAAEIGDAELAAWATTRAEGVLAQAYLPEYGSWSEATSGGVAETTSREWIAAELDQLAASLAMADASDRDRLAATQAFWLEHFVDEVYGGVWGRVDAVTGDVISTIAKHWEWKAGFHSFEHALVSYLAAAEMADEDAVLWFARQDGGAGMDFEAAYVFEGEVSEVTAVDLSGLSAQQVTYSALAFAAVADVPLPGAAGLLALGLGALAGLRRRGA